MYMLLQGIGAFPFDVFGHILILTAFQDRSSKVYDQYIRSIKKQNNIVSNINNSLTIKGLNVDSGDLLQHTEPHPEWCHYL